VKIYLVELAVVAKTDDFAIGVEHRRQRKTLMQKAPSPTVRAVGNGAEG